MTTATMADDPSIVLALGGGGARGLAQIGVIEVLLAHGLTVKAVTGTSCGALVGGCFAAGKLTELRDWMLRTKRNEMLRLLDPGFGRPAMFTGNRLLRTLRDEIGEPCIEDLPIDFTAVAVDLLRQREVWLRQGDMWDAIRASIAIPGIFTPITINQMELVDGGLLAPLPIAATRMAGPHRVIAVDIHAAPRDQREEQAAEAGREQTQRQSNVVLRWLGMQQTETLPDNKLGLMEVMSRALDTMQARISRVQLAMQPPELLIRIPRDACQFYEFWRASELIDIGRREAEKAITEAAL